MIKNNSDRVRPQDLGQRGTHGLFMAEINGGNHL